MRKIKLGSMLFVFMVFITGCATNYTPLDLNYVSTKSLEKKDVKVALIKQVILYLSRLYRQCQHHLTLE